MLLSVVDNHAHVLNADRGELFLNLRKAHAVFVVHEDRFRRDALAADVECSAELALFAFNYGTARPV